MIKFDVKKEHKNLYQPGDKKCVQVQVPDMNFIMIDGQGDPNTAPEYRQAVETLYAVAYTLKFMLKRENPDVDYVVPPLEGLWWCDDMTQFSVEAKDKWQWTMMIMQPEFITSEMVQNAITQVREKKEAPALDRIRFEKYHEGKAAQIMHVGPYSAEGPTVAAVHEFIRQQGKELRGKHHEIYLNDPRKTSWSKMKTVIRQPMG